jgi:hypothetical protein
MVPSIVIGENWEMRIRSAGLFSTISTIPAAALAFGLTTFVVFASHAGPTPPSGTATPSASPTATPAATATPTATPLPTPAPMMCATTWPETTIVTIAKGQSPTNNAKVSHEITGHIIDPGSLRDTAHRIEVCAGTEVTSTITDATGRPKNSADGGLVCTSGACSGVVDVKEKYQSISNDGRDKDSITFIPK